MVIKDIDCYDVLQNEVVKKGWKFYQSFNLDYHLVADKDYINGQIDEFLADYPDLQDLYRRITKEFSEMDKYRLIKRGLTYKD